VTLVVAPCPVCDGARFEPVYAGTIEDADADPDRYFSSSRAVAGHLPIVRCARCGLWLTSPRDDDATLAHVYASLVDPAYEAEDDNRSRMAREHLAFVERHRAAPGRLLDVGCATGALVRAARSAGWQATGLDASAWSIARARERCLEAEFVCGLVEDVSFPAARFDVITLWDALEHLPAPRATLARVREWLAPGGWLFLNVPNRASATSRLLGRHWVLLLREHLWYFAPDTLAALLDRVGFRCVETRPNRVRFSLHNVAVRLEQMPSMRGLGRALAAVPFARHVALRFPIGELNVAAVRTG
jgi:SAM-dependent methyltransferase